MAERGIDRKATFYYGARGKRGPLLREGTPRPRGGAAELPVRARPVRAGRATDWDGEIGLITDVVKRTRPTWPAADAYVCGPPPMVEAAMPLLAALGVEDKRIYYDKFTTTGDAEGDENRDDRTT